MQYCTECNAIEQGTITKLDESYNEEELRELGRKEGLKCKVELTPEEQLEWGKDKASYEICACCESNDETMTNFDEDSYKD